jgi:hypothetical protein
MPELPLVEVLRVPALLGVEDLSDLAPGLPNVRSVIVQNQPGHSFPVLRFADRFPDAEVTLDRR